MFILLLSFLVFFFFSFFDFFFFLIHYAGTVSFESRETEDIIMDTFFFVSGDNFLLVFPLYYFTDFEL